MKKVRRTERAIREIGEENIRRGSLKLGSTRRITPTRQGFQAVGRVVREISKSKKTFSYDISGTYIGADGKQKSFSMEQVGVPRMRDIRPKKGETKAEALSRTVETRIRREVMAVLKKELGGYTLAAKVEGRKISREQARAELRALKKSRGVKFKITFNREI